METIQETGSASQSDRKERRRAYLAERKRRLTEANLCERCAKATRAKGHICCQFCLDKTNIYQAGKRKKRLQDGLCVYCHSPRAPGKTYCVDCLAYRCHWVKEHIGSGLCRHCDQPVVPGKQVCEYHRAFFRAKSRRRAREARVEAINAYGGFRCACCGETTPEFLQIDHIAGGGNKHRKQPGVGGGANLYRWLIKNNFPPGFRVLCANCNLARGFYGECPHERQRRDAAKMVTEG